MSAQHGRRRNFRALSLIASTVVAGIAFSMAPMAEAKNAAKSTVPYTEPTPSEGGQVVRYNLTIGVAKKAPDCYRECALFFLRF